MTGRVEGKVALITGAARGQGRAHAVRLAREGADVIAIDICEQIEHVNYPMSTPEDLTETVKLVESAGQRVVSARVDVRNLAALKSAVTDGVEKLGRLDIIIANAGVGPEPAQLHNLAENLWQDMLDINLSGVWKTINAGVEHMLAGGRGGSIVLTSSVGGLKALPNVGHYVTAKHGVVGLMRTLALELGPHNIRVNSVHPTQVDTPMLMNESTFRLFRPDLADPGPEDFGPVSQMLHVLPVPWVEPEDVSNAVLFLASDEARYVTGVTLPIDAGSTLK